MQFLLFLLLGTIGGFLYLPFGRREDVPIDRVATLGDFVERFEGDVVLQADAGGAEVAGLVRNRLEPTGYRLVSDEGRGVGERLRLLIAVAVKVDLGTEITGKYERTPKDCDAADIVGQRLGV